MPTRKMDITHIKAQTNVASAIRKGVLAGSITPRVSSSPVLPSPLEMQYARGIQPQMPNTVVANVPKIAPQIAPVPTMAPANVVGLTSAPMQTPAYAPMIQDPRERRRAIWGYGGRGVDLGKGSNLGKEPPITAADWRAGAMDVWNAALGASRRVGSILRPPAPIPSAADLKMYNNTPRKRIRRR